MKGRPCPGSGRLVDPPMLRVTTERRGVCPVCGRSVARTSTGKAWTHGFRRR